MPAIGPPTIDIVDSSWLAARPAVVAAAVAEPVNWRRWWPGLRLRVDEWRGEKGVRWFVDSVDAGRSCGLAGTGEIWLEATCGGTVAHFFLRLDPAPGQQVPAGLRSRVEHDYRTRTKRAFWALGDTLDPGRVTRHTSTARGPT